MLWLDTLPVPWFLQILGRCIASANSPIDTVKKGVQQWIDLGVPPYKLVLGLPWYGECVMEGNELLQAPVHANLHLSGKHAGTINTCIVLLCLGMRSMACRAAWQCAHQAGAQQQASEHSLQCSTCAQMELCCLSLLAVCEHSIRLPLPRPRPW